jgi:hypothetical protein
VEELLAFAAIFLIIAVELGDLPVAPVAVMLMLGAAETLAPPALRPAAEAPPAAFIIAAAA